MKPKIIIGEILQFLQENNVTDLENLKNDYPIYKNLLSSGITMGDNFKTELEFRTELAEITLNSLVKKLKNELPKIKSRIKIYNNLAFISSLITTFSSSSILILIGENVNTIFVYLSAILTLIGALTSVIAQWKIQTFSKDSDSLMSIHERLIINLLEAEEIQKEYQILKNYETPESQINEILRKGNDLCKSVNHLLYLL